MASAARQEVGERVTGRRELDRAGERGAGGRGLAGRALDEGDDEMGDEEVGELAEELGAGRREIDADQIGLREPPEQPLAENEEAPEIVDAGGDAQALFGGPLRAEHEA